MVDSVTVALNNKRISVEEARKRASVRNERRIIVNNEIALRCSVGPLLDRQAECKKKAGINGATGLTSESCQAP